MFNNKKKELDKIWWVFNSLLLKLQKHPMHVQRDDVIKLYMRAIEVSKTVENLEYLYVENGKIDKDIIEGEEEYDRR